MSWYSKVAWMEGLFLRPHHLQQSDRYLEHLIENRVRHITPYPWGFSRLEIDRDVAQVVTYEHTNYDLYCCHQIIDNIDA